MNPDIRVNGWRDEDDERSEMMLRNPSPSAHATQHELVEELGWPQSTVARHVGTLRERGLVRGNRQGSEVLLEATAMPRYLLDTVCEWMHPEEPSAAELLDAANRGGVAAGGEEA